MAKFIVEKSVNDYMYDLLPPSDPAVLREMEARATREKIPIVGPAVGRMLALLVKITGAQSIFEMGSAIGYSTIWLAQAAGPKAEVHYSDADPIRAKGAQEYIRRAGLQKRIHMHLGDSMKALGTTKGAFDIIFLDVDKEYYPAGFKAAVPRVRRGGLFITDNVLWSGKVTAPSKEKETQAIQKFNKMVYASNELEPVIVPLRDGVAICRKK